MDFDFKENIESVEKNVIPEKMTSIYVNILEIMARVRKNYSDIQLSDIGSLNNFKNTKKYSDNKENALLQLNSLREMESSLLVREKELEDKLISGGNLSDEEYKLFSTLETKRDKIQKNKFSILKKIHFSNINVEKYDGKRLDEENNIEIARNSIKEDIEMLSNYMSKLEKNNLGLERLNGLSVQEHHIMELNNLIDIYDNRNHTYSSKENIDKLFKNSLEIRINMFKDIYYEASKLISSYKKQENIDFQKVNELEALFKTDIWNCPYILYPDVDKNMSNMNDRHLSEYADIVEQINLVSNGKMSKEEISDLKLKIYDENLMVDMAHNYLNAKEVYFSQYLSYARENVKETNIKHTM